MEELNSDQALLGRGHVYHGRTGSPRHGFKYPTFFILFDCQAEVDLLRLLARRFRGVLSFRAEDHLDGRPGPLIENVRAFLREHCAYEPERVSLQAYPRMFGFAFKPVSFWFCWRAGQLDAVLVEVNNTFGERHFYWLKPEGGFDGERWHETAKVFHVSPFFSVSGSYRFRFRRSPTRSRVDINHHAEDGSLALATWIEGELSPLGESSALALVARYGWMTALVWLRIHGQAARLFFKRARFFKKPEPPARKVTT